MSENENDPPLNKKEKKKEQQSINIANMKFEDIRETKQFVLKK